MSLSTGVTLSSSPNERTSVSCCCRWGRIVHISDLTPVCLLELSALSLFQNSLHTQFPRFSHQVCSFFAVHGPNGTLERTHLKLIKTKELATEWTVACCSCARHSTTCLPTAIGAELNFLIHHKLIFKIAWNQQVKPCHLDVLRIASRIAFFHTGSLFPVPKHWPVPVRTCLS